MIYILVDDCVTHRYTSLLPGMDAELSKNPWFDSENASKWVVVAHFDQYLRSGLVEETPK